MNIAVVSDHIPYPSASNINTLKHAQGFYDLGYNVEILSVERLLEGIWRMKTKNVQKFYGLSNKIQIHYFRGSILFYFDKFLLIRALRRPFRYWSRLYNFLDPQVLISRYCIKNKIDFVYCRSTFRSAFHTINNGIPTIIEYHSYWGIPELKNLLKIKNNRNFIGFVTIADKLKQNFIKFGLPKKKILVLEDAAQLNKFDAIRESKENIRKKLNLPLDKILILYTGGLYKDRDIKTVIDAAIILADTKLSFYFIGGNKKTIKKWEHYLNEKKSISKIHFLGLKPNRDIPYYLKAADILLATYSSNCKTIEWKSPIKIFEYMASKTPFITSDAGRLPEICANNECLYYKADDPIDLSQKIRLLADNKEIQNKLVINAYNKVKNYTYKKRCKKIIQFMQSQM